MHTYKKILPAALPLIAGLLIGIIMAQPQDNGIEYEVTPDITIEPRRSDVVEIVQAYERLMDRYIVLVQQDVADVNDQIQSNTATINQMSNQLDTMNTRLLAIAKALKVELPETGAIERIPLQQNQQQLQPQEGPQQGPQQIQQQRQTPEQPPQNPQRQSRRVQQFHYSY